MFKLPSLGRAQHKVVDQDDASERSESRIVRLFKTIQMRQICLVIKNLSVLKILLPLSCVPIYILT